VAGFAGKKLKRRLEDLERRAGSGESGSGSEKQSASSSKSTKRQQSATPKMQKTPPAPKAMAPQFTPPMAPYDEPLYAPQYDARERSQTPPIFSYSTYPPPDEMLLPPYGSTQPYPTMTTAETYPTYLAATVPVTLPPMTHFSDAIKHNEDGLSPYMNYGFITGIDVNATNAYDHSNPHVSYSRHLLPPRDPRC
jgi:hypothetical protein